MPASSYDTASEDKISIMNYVAGGEMEKSPKAPSPPFPHHLHRQLLMNSKNYGQIENIGKGSLYGKHIVVGERWKRLVGEFFFGGGILFGRGILFGAGKVKKYQILLDVRIFFYYLHYYI